MSGTRTVNTGYRSFALYQQPVKEVIRTPEQEKAHQQTLLDADDAKRRALNQELRDWYFGRSR